MVDPVDTGLPKAVRGTPLETDEGVETPVQQAVGSATVEGGGEWPDPDAPPRPPAPGALDDDAETAEAPSSSDPRVSRLVGQALALAQRQAPPPRAAAELLSASGGDPELLEAAERLCAQADKGQPEEIRRASAYLAAARSA